MKEREWYQARPVSELCCVPEVPKRQPVTQADKEFFRRTLLEACPESALALHGQRKRKASVRDSEQRAEDLASRLIMRTCGPLYPCPDIASDSFYMDVVGLTYEDSAQLCREPQGSGNWKQARRVRITASECYTFYTAQSGFTEKFSRITSSKFRGSSATTYGTKKEPEARALYETVKGCKVQQCGLVVPPMMPWIGCSPDGVVESSGGLRALEVKCPALCQSEDLITVVKQKRLPYLRLDDENLVLKPRHKYYAQIQLTLVILDIGTCDLCIYDGAENAVHILQVNRDDAFCRDLVQKLGDVFFGHILPHLKRHAQR